MSKYGVFVQFKGTNRKRGVYRAKSLADAKKIRAGILRRARERGARLGIDFVVELVKHKSEETMAKKKSGKGEAAQRRRKRSQLRRELAQAKTGARKASAQGDAKSWVSFTAKVHSLEGQIAALRAR